MSPRTRALATAGFLVGVGIGVYFTFAVDLVVAAGSLPRSSGGAVLVAIGAAGVAGGLAGDLVARVGLRAALWVTVAAVAVSLALLPLASTSPAGVMVSAVAVRRGLHRPHRRAGRVERPRRARTT